MIGCKPSISDGHNVRLFDDPDPLRWREVLAHLQWLTAAETNPKREPRRASDNKLPPAPRRARRNGKTSDK
jgi:hypothetical protein